MTVRESEHTLLVGRGEERRGEERRGEEKRREEKRREEKRGKAKGKVSVYSQLIHPTKHRSSKRDSFRPESQIASRHGTFHYSSLHPRPNERIMFLKRSRRLFLCKRHALFFGFFHIINFGLDQMKIRQGVTHVLLNTTYFGFYRTLYEGALLDR